MSDQNSTQTKRHGNASHGCTIGGRMTPEYNAWVHMKTRCYDTRCDKFEYYGGRGITVCQAWRESFEVFLADMGMKPSPKHELDRFPNRDGNYQPDNVRWATRKQNARNRRSNVMLEFDGRVMCLAEWAEELGMKLHSLKNRIRRGWSIERAFTQPLH